MEPDATKSKRHKVRKKRTRKKAKNHGVIIGWLGKIFGSTYLDNYQAINVGIIILIIIFIGLVLLRVLIEPAIEEITPIFSEEIL